MKKIAMATAIVVLAAAPVTAQQGEHHEQAEHPHQCPHHQGEQGQHPAAAHGMGGHEMDEHHPGMQEMRDVMMMMHHAEMLDLSEAQVQQLTALMERVHADGMPRMQDPEAMSQLVEEARAILTPQQRERLAEMEHPMGEGCPMMKNGRGGAGERASSRSSGQPLDGV